MDLWSARLTVLACRPSPCDLIDSARRRGSRENPLTFPPLVPVEIPRISGGSLQVPDAAALAEVFFSTEVSSLGASSYDARTLTTHPNQVDREDVHVLNSSFRAMIIKTSLWEPLFEAGDLPWIEALDPEWDLVMIGQEEWDNADIPGVIEEAILEVISVKGRGVAQATKLLHLKRPALVPVIDDFVARALGRRLSQDAAPPVRAGQARVIVEHLRHVGMEHQAALEAIDGYLRSVGIERTLVRILDCLIWCSEAESWREMSGVLARWRA